MFQRVRSVLFWLHLGLGVLASVVILMLCVTGAALAFELPVVRWADRQLVDPPEDVAVMASAESVATAAAGERGKTPESITLGRDPSDPAVASFGRRDRLYLNPWTGESLGEGAATVKGIFRGLMTFHRWFSLPDSVRNVGRAIVGASDLIFIVLILTGLVLWLPRRWRWRNVRAVLWFRRGLSARARDFNWHHVFGIWFALPLLFLAVTGAGISYDWFKAGLVRAAGGTPAERGHGPPRGKPPEEAAADPQAFRGADAALAVVAEAVPEWNQLTITRPSGPADPWKVTADTGNGRQPQHRVEVRITRAPLAVTSRSGWSDADRARQVGSIIRFGHTGEIAGWFGQLFAALASIAGVFLGVTGLTLSWRRYQGWRRRTH